MPRFLFTIAMLAGHLSDFFGNWRERLCRTGHLWRHPRGSVVRIVGCECTMDHTGEWAVWGWEPYDAYQLTRVGESARRFEDVPYTKRTCVSPKFIHAERTN